MDLCPRGPIMETEKMPCEPLAPADARRWFVDAAIGLDYLHFQGVVHYDLKPDNILIAHDGRALISDFGVSRVHPNKRDTTVGSPGTPTYTAPEVWGVGSYAAIPSDVWSLGVTLHAMVFGCLPYLAASQMELIELVTNPREWECSHACDDAELLALLRGMMQKVPGACTTLAQHARAHRGAPPFPTGARRARDARTGASKPMGSRRYQPACCDQQLGQDRS